MKSFELYKVKPEQGVTEGFEYVAFSTSYLSRLSEITDLEEQLAGKFHGRVLVDNVCKMGQNSDRLLTVHFDGECFDFDSLELQVTASRPLRLMLSAFYKEHPNYVNASVLSSIQQKMILRGLPLGHTVHT